MVVTWRAGETSAAVVVVVVVVVVAVVVVDGGNMESWREVKLSVRLRHLSLEF